MSKTDRTASGESSNKNSQNSQNHSYNWNWKRYLLVAILVAISSITIISSPSIYIASRALSTLRSISVRSLSRPISLIRPPSAVRTMATSSTSRADPCGTACDGKAAKKYTAAEERVWQGPSEGMQYFHNHFRHSFNRIYQLADGSFQKEGMKLPRFLREADQLNTHLSTHHSIEEVHIFPYLAKKMPQFKAGARESGEHLKSHKAIHKGLDQYEKFIQDSLAHPNTYDYMKLREIMDSFREVLFRHLDEEVEDLKPESLKAAGWTVDEIRRLPF